MLKANNKNTGLRATALGVVTLALAACATVSQPPEAVVTERAQERLDALIAQDYAAAYEYLSPGYRSGVSLNDYTRRMLSRRMQWTNATVGESDCSEDACKLRISIDYEIFGAVPGVSRFKSKAAASEDWVRLDGTWYLVPSD